MRCILCFLKWFLILDQIFVFRCCSIQLKYSVALVSWIVIIDSHYAYILSNSSLV